MKILQALLIVATIQACLAVFSANCNLILRELPGNGKGVGVFAGKDWYPNEKLELAVGIPVPYEAVYWTELINYCEGYNDTHALLTLGYSMLYNHIPHSELSMVQKHMSSREGVVQFNQVHERSTDVYFEPNSVIFAGDQIYSHYGDDWFADRGFDEIPGDPATNSIVLDRETSAEDIIASQKHPRNLPGCPQQMTFYKQNVLRAAVNITAGEYIEVVRALLMPHWAVAHAGAMGEFLWWKPATPSNSTVENVIDNGDTVRNDNLETLSTQDLYARFGSPYAVTPYNRSDTEYALLLTGRGALYSPSSISLRSDASTANSGDEDEYKLPNVQYDWWPTADSEGIVDCSLTMLVSFRAIRHITKGEELVVDLTADAQTARKYPSAVFADVCL